MKVINYFDSDNKDFWLEQLKKNDWVAGGLLVSFITENKFFEKVGDGSKILLLTDENKLISFCTYAKRDDIQNTDLTPWMGFVYAFPEYRGHHYVGKLFEEVNRLAKEQGYKEVYISTNYAGLYEKYGCEYKTRIYDSPDKSSRVYIYHVK